MRKTIPQEVSEKQINDLEGMSFVRWDGVYINRHSRAVCVCKVDGHVWVSCVYTLLSHGRGCPVCSGKMRRTSKEREGQINDLHNISFVSLVNSYRGALSKAVVRCSIDGHEWSASVNNLVNAKRGCPRCAKYGYDNSKPSTLYALRSECGSMVKIGISNNYKARLIKLKLKTPFEWLCIDLLHSNDGAFISMVEKEIHAMTERAEFTEAFEGYTEWRKWDDRIPMWIEEYRARA